ncbi:MAG: FxsA family protein [Firmicutes bacterium]|nr:FxsA family protein [Bacillota bacterium]
MFFKLLLLFTIVPLVELYLLIELGKVVGAPLTIVLVGITGFIGVILAKAEGLAVLGRLRYQLEGGELPGDALLDGLFILVGSAFLLTPGLITDTFGFLFLVPLTRLPLRLFLKRKLAQMMADGSMNVYIRRW